MYKIQIPKVNHQDLALIKYFSQIKLPYWVVGIPFCGAYAYIRFKGSFFKLLNNREFASKDHYRLLIKMMNIFNVPTFFVTLFSTNLLLVLSLTEVINFPFFPYAWGINFIVNVVFWTLFNFILQPLVIAKHHASMWKRCVKFYGANVVAANTDANYQIVFDTKRIFRSFLHANLAEIDIYSFITPVKVMKKDSLLYLSKFHYRIYAKGGAQALIDLANATEIYTGGFLLRFITPYLKNGLLRFSGFTFFAFVYLINSLNPLIAPNKMHRLVVGHFFKAVITYLLVAASVFGIVFFIPFALAVNNNTEQFAQVQSIVTLYVYIFTPLFFIMVLTLPTFVNLHVMKKWKNNQSKLINPSATNVTNQSWQPQSFPFTFVTNS